MSRRIALRASFRQLFGIGKLRAIGQKDTAGSADRAIPRKNEPTLGRCLRQVQPTCPISNCGHVNPFTTRKTTASQSECSRCLPGDEHRRERRCVIHLLSRTSVTTTGSVRENGVRQEGDQGKSDAPGVRQANSRSGRKKTSGRIDPGRSVE